MLVDILNPRSIYPFYNIPKNITQDVLDTIYSIKYIQLAIQLKKDIPAIALYMIAGTQNTIVFSIVIDDETSFTVTYTKSSGAGVFSMTENDTFNLISDNSIILFSLDTGKTFLDVKIEVLPLAFIFYPILLKVETFYKTPSIVASLNTDTFSKLLLQEGKDLFSCSLFSGFNCLLSYINKNLIFNSFTAAGKGIITLFSDKNNDFEQRTLLLIRKKLEGIYSINGMYGDVNIKVGNSVSVLYKKDEKEDLLQIHFLLPKTEEVLNEES